SHLCLVSIASYSSNLHFLPVGSVVDGKTYYVSKSGNDKNSGLTESHPFKTIQHAANVVVAGSVVNVKAGEYDETVVIHIQGNSKDGYITFQNYKQDKVIITGKSAKTPAPDGSLCIIYLQNKSYIKIIGFEIKTLKATDGSGIRINGAGSHIEIRSNKIHDIRGGGKSGGAMGITVYNTNAKMSLSQIIIDSNEVYDCDPAWSEALTLNGNIEQFQITRNRVHDVNNIGIDMIGGESWTGKQIVRNGICANNTVWNIHSVYDQSAAAIYVDGARNITIQYNEVYRSDFGMEIGAENKGIIASQVVVKNNFIHDNDQLGLAFGGYDSKRGRVQNCIFEYNVLQSNDRKHSGFGEIVVSFASKNKVQYNVIQPNDQNIVLSTNAAGNVNNIFDYDRYILRNGNTADDLIFEWGNKKYNGLSRFQKKTKQELHAVVRT
ncbi:unnamed protein product, partial [Didymodactylos carnosus]